MEANDVSEFTFERGRSDSLGRVALALGLLSPVLFFFGTVAGIFWFVGGAVGLAAVIVGVQALRRGERARGGRAMAAAGALIGAVITGWFVVYIVIEAAS
jgi:hypothetical protein